jgi:hypothetical protein
MLANTPRDTAERIEPLSEHVINAMLDIDWRAVRLASHSCCCSSRPAVVAVMPPSASRPHSTELLLCGHHYRRSRAALAAAGAMVLDLRGMPLPRQQEDWDGLPA